jgi:hypothetical protein
LSTGFQCEISRKTVSSQRNRVARRAKSRPAQQLSKSLTGPLGPKSAVFGLRMLSTWAAERRERTVSKMQALICQLRVPKVQKMLSLLPPKFFWLPFAERYFCDSFPVNQPAAAAISTHFRKMCALCGAVETEKNFTQGQSVLCPRVFHNFFLH